MRKNDSLVYEDAKEKCLAFLREGKDCAFVTIGDPSVFSTAGKFASMICGTGFGAKFLAGIPSFCQAAASASTVLCQAEEDLHIICGDEQDEWKEKVYDKVADSSNKNVFVKPGYTM